MYLYAPSLNCTLGILLVCSGRGGTVVGLPVDIVQSEKWNATNTLNNLPVRAAEAKGLSTDHNPQQEAGVRLQPYKWPKDK